MIADLHITLPSSSGPREVELRIPSIRRLSGLLHDDGAPRDEHLLALWLPIFTIAFVNRLDGKRLHFDRVDGIAADATFMRALIAHVRALLDAERERGKIFVLCPGCRGWEVEVPITAYALAIACPIPSTFDGPFLAVPSLASRTLLGERRTPLPRTPRVRFELPSTRLAAVLGKVKHQPEEYVPPVSPEIDDDEDEDIDEEAEDDDTGYPANRSGAGWRALLRLSRAIEPPMSVEDLEQLPAVDFFFLELAHFLVAMAPVRDDTPGRIVCASCKTVFLPVSPDAGQGGVREEVGLIG